MKDTIYREDAIKAINQVGWLEDSEYESRILAIPSADRPQLDKYIVERIGNGNVIMSEDTYEDLLGRPQAEWIKHDEERDYCSACKHIFKTRTLTKQDKWTTYVDDLGYNYCPNCGAKMKGSEK